MCQLLDLMHTLHSRTAQIFKWWRDEADQGHGEIYKLHHMPRVYILVALVENINQF